ncbi:MAG: hypothetical protein UT84_C0011G0020 [Candidatus Curtissbacteria bacterium GW2011_GWA1_40_16]|uniref:Uncharacterized protein n=1 Tax=Candidatus Curtissbacteria bacterium GW2011_GWA1_40_16 TaxID=1618405 RepID=A0A0G0RCM0_9BACT|nr:MAG: hypothetical protein UT84_C0011G0020 [Candidatus Curtissbacteria bacterium GW2011_GWA1_40_16]
MIKKILAPVQAWILLQGKCVGCGKNLSLARKFERVDNSQKVICSCNRIFIFDKRIGRYKRATIEEAKA